MANAVFRPVTINFATQRVPGNAAGVPLLALVIVIAIVLPEARWLLVSGVVFGAVAGAAMIYVRQRQRIDPGRDGPTLLDPHAPLDAVERRPPASVAPQTSANVCVASACVSHPGGCSARQMREG